MEEKSNHHQEGGTAVYTGERQKTEEKEWRAMHHHSSTPKEQGSGRAGCCVGELSAVNFQLGEQGSASGKVACLSFPACWRSWRGGGHWRFAGHHGHFKAVFHCARRYGRFLEIAFIDVIRLLCEVATGDGGAAAGRGGLRGGAALQDALRDERRREGGMEADTCYTTTQ